MSTWWQLRHSRRSFLATSALATLACADRRAVDAADVEVGDSNETWTLFVGTYTNTGKSRGIYALPVARRTLALGAPTLVAETPDPSFLAVTPDGLTLVAVNELTTYDGVASGALTTFARTPNSNVLTPRMPMQSSRGAAPCYVSIDHTGKFVFVANYVGGNVGVFPLGAGGVLGEVVAMVPHEGRGPNARRQEHAHAHCILPDPANRFVLSADLGTDRVYVSRFDAHTGALTPADVPDVALAPGAGPRHLAFGPDGRTLYCVNELNSTLAVFSYDAQTGGLTERQVVSTRPAGASGDNAPADLHVHPSGRAVYVSNRGDNTLAVFTVNATGQLTLLQSMSTGGDWPRNFTLTPDAGALLVAHQRSDSITVFRVDGSTGALTDTNIRAQLPVPVCLRFA